jgi:hypothetical protein
VDTLVRLVNEDLERIRRWSVSSMCQKTQAMLISRRDRGVVVEHPLTVGGDVVVFSDSVKNLGLGGAGKPCYFSYVFYSSNLSISEIYFS